MSVPYDFFESVDRIVANIRNNTHNITFYRRMLVNEYSLSISEPIRRISYGHFYIVYSTYHKLPLAVHQLLDKNSMRGQGKRTNFFQDPNIEDRFASNDNHYRSSAAYSHFKLARGHMAAAGNYGTQPHKHQTFTFANIIPQNQLNNGGIWNTFERYSRNLLTRNLCLSVEIISGPIFTKNKPYINSSNEIVPHVYEQRLKVLGDNGIIVPDKLYKIIKCNQNYNSYIAGFTFPNQSIDFNSSRMIDFLTPIQQIQNQTGLLFNISNNKNTTLSLTDLDYSYLNRTKLEEDTNYFDQKLKDSQTFSQFKSYFWRTKQQSLHLKPSNYKSLIDQLVVKDILESSKHSGCSYLNSLMSLDKSLNQFQIISEYQQRIKQQQLKTIQECFSSGTNYHKDAIMKKLLSKRWYKFINQELLINKLIPDIKGQQPSSNHSTINQQEHQTKI